MGIEWLKPGEGPESNYNPHDNVEVFIKENGRHAGIVLEIFNNIDPLHSYYGDDVNPDEYIGCAERFLKSIKPFEEKPTTEQIQQAVMDSFNKGSIEDGFVDKKDIDSLVKIFSYHIYKSETGEEK